LQDLMKFTLESKVSVNLPPLIITQLIKPLRMTYLNIHRKQFANCDDNIKTPDVRRSSAFATTIQ
jgi:hypothetical protein